MQSLMLSLSGMIEAMVEFYRVHLLQKEKTLKNKKRDDALCTTKNAVNHFPKSCSEFLKILFFRKSCLSAEIFQCFTFSRSIHDLKWKYHKRFNKK